MALAPAPELRHALLALCEDTLFTVTASTRLDADVLRGLADRRAQAVTAAARAGADPMSSWDTWITTLCAAIAPISPPRWMPMAEAIDHGLSLEHGARGMRALFTSKPSDKDVQRVRVLGALAVRAVGAVFAASGTFHDEARLLRSAVVASLGLPDEDQAKLNGEAPPAADALEVYGNVDPKLARSIVKGAFFAAMGDGMDPREEDAVTVVARKVGLGVDELNAARSDARQAIDAAKPLGEAAVDAIRYVLSDDEPDADRFAVAAARLLLPPTHRRDAITAVNVGGHVTLGQKYALDRRQREAVLALAWTAAIAGDPTYARRVLLQRRHERVAEDLGTIGDGAAARAAVEQHLDAELGRFADGR